VICTRIQKPSSRLIYHDVCQVQKLLGLIDRGDREPGPSPDGDAMA